MNTEANTPVAVCTPVAASRGNRFMPGIIFGVLVGAFTGAFGQPFVEARLAQSHWRGSAQVVAATDDPRGSEAMGRTLAAAPR